MAVSSAFRLALEIFDLDRDPAGARQEIWRMLGPRIEAVADRYVEQLTTHTPYYRDLATTKRTFLARHIARFTEGLFRNPFDEQWVADTKARVEEEIELGLDVRNRCVINQIVLAELCEQVGRRYRLFSNHGAHLLEIAIRVMLLDATNAVALHYHAAVREAKERSTQLDGAIQSFGRAIEGVRRVTSSAVASLAETSKDLTALADAAVEQARDAAAAANRTASNADQMAAAVSQMMSSISEIREQAMTSATMAQDALAAADRTNAMMRSLSQTVSRIGSVTALISDVAAQTHLIALNASIEASRVGEAGRGFAVVAAEVKSLAAQTSRATREIGEQVSGIEKGTVRSAEEIAGTGRTIGQIAEAAQSVAAAVHQQEAVTASIASEAQGAAANATSAAGALQAVAETIQRTQSLAASVLESSRELYERSREIDAAMDALFQVASTQGGVRKIADLKKAAGQLPPA